MARRKAIDASFRVVASLFSVRLSSSRPPCSQVTLFSGSSLSVSSQSQCSSFIDGRPKLFFSSTPNSVLELVVANDWSEELENDLEKRNSDLSHETVVYVLKNLDKHPRKTADFFNWAFEKKGFKPSSSIYSLMLRIFSQNDLMKQFWISIRQMKEQGFYIDEETYLTILAGLKKEKKIADATALSHFYNRMLQENAMDSVAHEVVKVVLGSEWSDTVEERLGDLKITLSHSFLMRVLKELRFHPLKALRFFHWVGRHPDYEHSTVMYNAIARVLSQSDSIGDFWSIIGEMKGAGHYMDLDNYIKISRQFQKKKLMEDAVKLYEHMMDSPYKPQVQHCIALLRSISVCHTPDLNLVFRVAKKYESTGHTLSKAVYDGIHRSLTAAGRFDEAAEIVTTMKNAGYEPDNITYSQLIFGLCKARRLAEACKVVEEIEAQGHNPDIKTWTILIQGHCAANEVDKALILLAEMMEKNCDPDADLLEVLINGFLSRGKSDGAYKLLVEMVEKAHVRPWQSTYKQLVEVLLKVRKLEEALKLLRLMKKHNYPPFPQPFVEYISKFGTVENASDLLKALTAKEYPSLKAYIYIFESFFKEGRYSEAKDLLYKCPHHVRSHGSISQLFGSAKSVATAVRPAD